MVVSSYDGTIVNAAVSVGGGRCDWITGTAHYR